MNKTNTSEITEIFDRCLKGTASQAERNIFYDWVELPENQVEAVKMWETAFANSDGSLNMDDRRREGMMEAILNANKDLAHTPEDFKPVYVDLPRSSPSPVHRVHFLKTSWFRYAAILLLIVGTVNFLFYKNSKTSSSDIGLNQQQMENITPGKDGAILTLADGTEMVLDSLGNGIVTTQEGTKIVLNNGQLQYEADGSKNTTVTYNTIRTPKGRQFKLILSDGTAVWLNSGSLISYPTVFESGNRTVRMEGEVYFEVTQNRRMPFMVNVRDHISVEVLGTHFNINSYDKEQIIKTTLVEGSVRVYGGLHEEKAQSVLLKPGQQARVSSVEKINEVSSTIQTSEVDISNVIAWKNGLFNFEDASLQEVMNQLERWYDIDVVYEKGVPNMVFVGKMSREMKLTNLLKALEQSGVHFRLEEGRKLVVMP